jgi:hypothetical protein
MIVFRAFRRSLSLAALLLLAAGFASAQVGGGPCSPQGLGELPVGGPLILSGSNDGLGPGPDPWPDCGTGDNARWYRFRLPPGFTNARVTVQPLSGSMAPQVALFDTTACSPMPMGAFIPGSDACAPPGAPVMVPAPGVCLPEGAPILLRVSGEMPGPFQLTLEALVPTCGDGCRNGFETGVDSLAAPGILVSGGDSSLCAGDLVFLQVTDAALYTSVVWSGGFSGAVLPVNQPGSYQAVVTAPGGCTAVADVRLYYDSTCVWPGDADRNDRVEARDLLPLGLGSGLSGPPRGGATGVDPFLFVGQAADDWPFEFRGVYGTLNAKHADVDGNGFIEPFDTAGIARNYGAVVPADAFGEARFAPLARALADPPLHLVFEADSFEVGDTVRGTVHAGDSLQPVESLYGYAFHLTLPEPFMVPGSFDLDFSGSWLDDDGNVTGFWVQQPGAPFADVSFTRTDQNGRTGFGPLFAFAIVVEDNLDGRLTKTRLLPFGFDNLLAIDSVADSVSLRTVPDSVLVSQFCDSRGNSTAGEYIDGFRVNGKKVLTGDDGGYREILVTAGQLQASAGYAFGFKPGFPGAPAPQHWRCWLDVNADGDFDDPGELLVDEIQSGIFQRPVTVPDTATLGWTTLRIQMKRDDGVPPQPCDTFAYGEVEDYRVQIAAAGPRLGAGDAERLQVWPNPSSGRLVLGPSGEDVRADRLLLFRADGTPVAEWPLEGRRTPLRLDLGGLAPGGYLAVLRDADGRRWRGRVLIVR